MSGVCYSYIPPIEYPCWECENEGDTSWCYVDGCERVREYREREKIRKEESENGMGKEENGKRKLLFAVD